MECASAPDLFELAPQPPHPLADHPTVGFDLSFARPTKEAEATALALEVRPAPHQTALLVIEMRQFHL